MQFVCTEHGETDSHYFHPISSHLLVLLCLLPFSVEFPQPCQAQLDLVVHQHLSQALHLRQGKEPETLRHRVAINKAGMQTKDQDASLKGKDTE